MKMTRIKLKSRSFIALAIATLLTAIAPKAETAETINVVFGPARESLSELDGGASKLLAMVPDLKLPSPRLLSNYAKALTAAFFEVYIAQNQKYLPYLNPAYAAYLSRDEEFKTHVITGESSATFTEAIDAFIAEKNINSDVQN